MAERTKYRKKLKVGSLLYSVTVNNLSVSVKTNPIINIIEEASLHFEGSTQMALVTMYECADFRIAKDSVGFFNSSGWDYDYNFDNLVKTKVRSNIIPKLRCKKPMKNRFTLLSIRRTNKTYIFFDKNDAEEFYFEVLKKMQLKTKEKIINRIDEIKYRQDKVNLHMRQNASLVDILKVPFGSVIDKEPLILPTDEEDD